MSDLICPVCGKPNPNTAGNCQYCGANLNQAVDLKPSPDLPSWVNNMRPTSNTPEQPPAAPQVTNPAAQPPTPAVAKKPDNALFPDYLAGLSNLGDDEDDESSDWLNSLQGILPTPPPPPSRPAPKPAAPETPAPAQNENVFISPPSNSQPPDYPQADSQTADTGADWLRAFDLPDTPSGSRSAGPDAEIDPTMYADLPDWLASLAGVSGQPDSFQADTRAAEQSQSSEPVDWLSSLGGDFRDINPDENSAAGESSAMSGEETPDWLARMSEGSSAPVKPASAEPGPAQDQPDWLTSLSSSALETSGPLGAQEDQESPALLASDNELSDWSVGSSAVFGTPGDSQTQGTSEADDLPDWMAGLRSSTPSSSQPGLNNAQSQVFSSSDTLPDWMSGLQGSAPASFEPGTDSSQTSAVSPFDTELMGNFHDDIPDWMNNQQASTATPEKPASAPVPPTTQPSDSAPDWLTSLQGTAPASQTSLPKKPEIFPSSQQDDTEDWLSSLQNSSALELGDNSTQSQPGTSAAASNDDTPDWLTNLQGGSTSTPSAHAPAAAQAETTNTTDDSVPDWLASLQSFSDSNSANPDINQALPLTPAAPNPAEIQTQNQPFDSEFMAGFSTPGGTGELPDWLARVSQPTGTDNKSSQKNTNDTPGVTGSETSQTRAEIPGSGDEKTIESVFSMETPDWLSNFLPAAQPASAAVEKTPTAANLPTAELPSWVQALRPMESVVEETSSNGESDGVENEGPLAGLRSVLPTQPGLPGVRTPRVIAHDLLTNETQQAQAALLENLVKSERTPRGLTKRARSSRVQPLRWGIAAALLIVILVFAALGSMIFPTPASPAESAPAGMFYKTVENLPESSPVLVVMDYQPGYAGELESELKPVMAHLMSKKTRLAFVSTSPVGGLLADRLLSGFASSYPYQAGQQYVELGYIPGGAGGIKIFADQPAATVGQDILSGNLWETAALKDVTVNSVTSLSNFAAVIVATDNPEIGRLWIEQAQPTLGSKPMLMVVSAQAEPMIQPYLQSKQITGLVAGLEGGLIYESASGKPGQARAYWDAYSAALLIAELIIIIGGAWGLGTGLRIRRTEMEQDED